MRRAVAQPRTHEKSVIEGSMLRFVRRAASLQHLKVSAARDRTTYH